MKSQSIVYLDKGRPFNEVPDHLVLLNYLGHAYVSLDDLPALERVIEESVARFDNARVYFRAACLFSLAQQEQKAFLWLEKAFQAGFCDMRILMGDVDLENLRDKEKFYWLIEKYFPGYV